MASTVDDLDEEGVNEAYRRILEEVNNGTGYWGFDALDEGQDNWNMDAWDDPEELERLYQSAISQQPYTSSSTFNNSSPPRPTASDRNPHSPSLQNSHPPPGSMGNPSSSADNPTNADTQFAAPTRTHPRSTANNRSSSSATQDSASRERRRRQETNLFGYDPPSFDFDTLDSQDTPSGSFDGIDIDDVLTSDGDAETETDEDMPVSSRRRQNLGRGMVDLTNDSSPPRDEPSRQPRSLKRTAASAAVATGSASQSRPSKRSRHADSEAQSPKIEELDLTNEAPSAEEELLQAQQQAAIKAQQAADESRGPLRIGKRTCIICMEKFTDATITHCGHIYCHECLTQALMAGEKNSDRGIGNCPVCRKSVSRKKANQLIVVNFMKKSAFAGSGRQDVGVFS